MGIYRVKASKYPNNTETPSYAIWPLVPVIGVLDPWGSFEV